MSTGVSYRDPLRGPDAIRRRVVNAFTAFTFSAFTVCWSVDTYLMLYGSTAPVPMAGKIYPITIHGGVVYGTRWQYYVTCDRTFVIVLVLFVLTFYFRRMHLRDPDR
jgi:hypothetical protein